MVTLVLFLVGVVSMITLDPAITAYSHQEPSIIWRFTNLFTHIVSHANWEHLIGNFLFGGPYLLYLEQQVKSAKTFTRAFFGFGFAALVCYLIFDQFSQYHSVGIIGSSGAIFGVVGAALMCPKKNKTTNILAKLLLLFFIFSQASEAITSITQPTPVAYAAHLGGLIAGVLFSYHRHRRL